MLIRQRRPRLSHFSKQQAKMYQNNLTIFQIMSFTLNYNYYLTFKMIQVKKEKSKTLCNHILRLNQDREDIGNLYLGSYGSVDPEILSERNVSIVLTVMDSFMYNKKSMKERGQKINLKQHKWINLEDDEQADIAKYFDQSYEFIDKSLANHNVLVHCQAGVSRSASIVIFYVMKKLHLNLQLANKFVVSKRYMVSPNQGFWLALKKKEQELQLSPAKSDKSHSQIPDPQSEFATEKYPQKFVNHIVCLNNDKDIQKGNLFLGQYAILRPHFLKSLKIKSVLSVVQESYYKRMKIKEILQHEGIEKHLLIDIKDDPTENLKAFFQQSFYFINSNIQTGNVLVHCQAGVSRSASVVIAFIIKKFKVDFTEALSFVQSKRKAVNPNQGFQLSLIQYSQQIVSKEKK